MTPDFEMTKKEHSLNLKQSKQSMFILAIKLVLKHMSMILYNGFIQLIF